MFINTNYPDRQKIKGWEALTSEGFSLKDYYFCLQTSLIPETLRDMLSDQEFQAAQRALQAKGQLALTKEERKQRQRALDDIGVPSFIQKVSFFSLSFYPSNATLRFLINS